jgi:hypothetical protein
MILVEIATALAIGVYVVLSKDAQHKRLDATQTQGQKLTHQTQANGHENADEEPKTSNSRIAVLSVHPFENPAPGFAVAYHKVIALEAKRSALVGTGVSLADVE